MTDLNVSKYLHYVEVDTDIYIGWNRFFPSIFILNKAAIGLLDRIDQQTPFESNDNIAYFINESKKHKFLYEGDTDPSEKDFLALIDQKLKELDRNAREFYDTEADYNELKFMTNVCNLGCSYCVNKHAASLGGGQFHPHERMRAVEMCIDQFFERKVKRGVREAKVFFNGGEMLADWPLMEKIVNRISTRYSQFNVEYSINTNMTLLTEEIARFFNRHHFKVHLSIDGYRDAHDKSRVYHNGKGSFDDVIRNVELYRMHNPNTPPVIFQGTIKSLEDFKPEDVYRMDRYGFAAARLAPNLLEVSEEDAREKAKLMGWFLESNTPEGFRVEESIFTTAKNKINQDAYRFAFNCPGLSGFPRLGIEFNLTELSVSHLCGYIKKAAMPFKDLNENIYDPALWDHSSRYIRERMDTLRRECMECRLVGICAGGCILSGIDQWNRLNKAACVYQNDIWEIYLKKVYRDRKKKKA
ncbi:MAG: radical SAM protein [Candidatus Omnitrophota bacterium]